VLEALPRLMGLDRASARAPHLVVPQRLVPWQVESLELLGLGAVPRLILGPRYLSVDVVHLPSFVGSAGHPHPAACAWLRARLVGPPLRPGHRRLYVTRRRAGRRHVINEAELVPVLNDLGFEVVECEALTFRAQVALFREAEIVVGPHGAGLTNLVWAPAGCRVLELFGHRCVRSLFYVLAALLAQRYAFLVGTSVGSIGVHADEGVYDMHIPPRRFASALRAVLSAGAMTPA
jgi:capsular polysaccharide biosynthesis protein